MPPITKRQTPVSWSINEPINLISVVGIFITMSQKNFQKRAVKKTATLYRHVKNLFIIYQIDLNEQLD